MGNCFGKSAPQCLVKLNCRWLEKKIGQLFSEFIPVFEKLLYSISFNLWSYHWPDCRLKIKLF